MKAAGRDILPVLVGLGLIILVLAVPFASGPPALRAPRAPEPQIMWLKPVLENTGAVSAGTSVNRGLTAKPSESSSFRAGAGASRLPAPPVPPAFDAGAALLPESGAVPASLAGIDPSALYAYLADIRRRLQLAIAHDQRIKTAPRPAPGSSGAASLSIWVAPSGRLLRAEAPSAGEAHPPSTGDMERVLIDAALSLTQLPPPPRGLPQPIEIGLEGMEFHPRALEHFIEE